MTLQLLHSEFAYLWGKFDFHFYQCILQEVTQQVASHGPEAGSLLEDGLSQKPEASPTLEEIHLELRLTPSPANLR
jgi:hypothetical protein